MRRKALALAAAIVWALAIGAAALLGGRDGKALAMSAAVKATEANGGR